jgi:hypothetical protein
VITVLFFAGLRETVGTASEALDLPAGVNTVAAIGDGEESACCRQSGHGAVDDRNQGWRRGCLLPSGNWRLKYRAASIPQGHFLQSPLSPNGYLGIAV